MATKFEYLESKEQLTARLKAIDDLFSEPDEHVKYLSRFIPWGLRCRYCGCPDVEWYQCGRKVECNNCRRITRVTASTFFHGVRRIEDWVRAIKLIESGYVFSANLFSTITGMATSSVEMMMQKIRYVLATQMPETPVSTTAACMDVVCKRSLKTPGGMHPQTEQDEFDEMTKTWLGTGVDTLIERAINKIYGHKSEEKIAATKTTKKTLDKQKNDKKKPEKRKPDEQCILWANEKKIYKQLSYEPVSFDTLMSTAGVPYQDLTLSLLHLTLAGLAERIDGDKYAQKRLALPILAEPLKSATVNFKDFFRVIEKNFHGISRKYLQLYIADYWCSINRTRWSPGSLFIACFEKGRVRNSQIKSYVSPPVVNVWADTNVRGASVSQPIP